LKARDCILGAIVQPASDASLHPMLQDFCFLNATLVPDSSLMYPVDLPWWVKSTGQAPRETLCDAESGNKCQGALGSRQGFGLGRSTRSPGFNPVIKGSSSGGWPGSRRESSLVNSGQELTCVPRGAKLNSVIHVIEATDDLQADIADCGVYRAASAGAWAFVCVRRGSPKPSTDSTPLRDLTKPRSQPTFSWAARRMRKGTASVLPGSLWSPAE